MINSLTLPDENISSGKNFHYYVLYLIVLISPIASINLEKIGNINIITILLILLFWPTKTNYTFNKKTVSVLILLSLLVFYDFILNTRHADFDTAIITALRRFFSFFLTIQIVNYFVYAKDSEVLSIEKAFLVSNTFAALIYIVIFIFFEPLKSSIAVSDKFGYRLTGIGFSDNPNGYGLVQLVVSSFTLSMINRKNYLILLLILGINILALIFCQTRSAMIALVFVAILKFILSLRNKPNSLLFFLIIGLFLYFLLPMFIDDLNTKLELSRFNDNQVAGSIINRDNTNYYDERGSLIMNGLITFSRHIFGVGSNCNLHYMALETGSELISHNYYIECLISYGIVVGLFYVSLILYPALYFLKHIRTLFQSSNNESGLFMSLYFLYFAVIINQFFHSQEWFIINIFIAALFAQILKSDKSTDLDHPFSD